MGEVAKAEARRLDGGPVIGEHEGRKWILAWLKDSTESVRIDQARLRGAWAESAGRFVLVADEVGAFEVEPRTHQVARSLVDFVNEKLGPVLPMRVLSASGCRLRKFDPDTLLLDICGSSVMPVRRGTASLLRRGGELRVMTSAVEPEASPTMVCMQESNRSAAVMRAFFGMTAEIAEGARALDEVKFTADGIGGQHAEGTFNGERVRFSREAVVRGKPQGEYHWVEVRARTGLESYLLPNTGDAVRFLFGTPAIPDEAAAPKAEPKSFAFDAKEGNESEGESQLISGPVEVSPVPMIFARQYWVDAEAIRVKDGPDSLRFERASVRLLERVGDHLEVLIETDRHSGWTRVRFPGIDAKVVEFLKGPAHSAEEESSPPLRPMGAEPLKAPQEGPVRLIGDRSDIRVAAGWIQTNEWACRVSSVTGVRIEGPRSSGLRAIHLYAGACVEAYTVDDLRPEHVAAILDAVTGGVA